MTTPTLREPTWRDLAVLAELDADLFGHEAWSEATWWSELGARPQRRYVVADDRDGIVGYAGIDAPGHDVADVMTIAVLPRSRGTGLSGTLMRWMREQAVDAGAVALMLEVRADNEPAKSLYAEHGFEQIAVRRNYYQPDGVDALVLRALLEEDR